MPFMLLIKGPDDNVRLLADSLSATRKDAMEELSRLTSDPAFSDWDAEVFVVDIDQATPVLLVRPSAEPEPVERRADSTEVEPEPDPMEEHTEATETDSEPEAGQDDASLTELVSEPETLNDDPDLTAVLRNLAEEDDAGPSGVEEAALDLVSAAAAVETVDPAWADAVMSSAGDTVEPDDEAASDLVDDVEPEPAETAAPERSVRQVVAQAAAEFEASGVRVPMSVRVSAPAGEEGSLDDTVESEDTGAEGSSAASDSGSSTGPWPWSEEPPDMAEPDILLGLDEPLAEAGEQDAEAAGSETPAPEPVALEASDFVELDDLSVAEPSAIQPPGYRAEDAASQAGMSCEDCIYVETCPHKGEQDPASCGSFQWR